MTDPLLDRLRQQVWPEVARDWPAPAIGQLWRASWRVGTEETACTVIVVADAPLGTRSVDVVPAGDDSYGDETTVKVTTTNGLGTSAWTGLRRSIYKFTLDQRLGDLTGESSSKMFAVINGDTNGDWTPIVDVLDDRSLERADLQDRLEVLAGADWVPKAASGRSFADLVEAAGLGNRDLATALQTSPGEAQRLRRGVRPPRPDEIPVLTDLLGEAPSFSAAYEPDLVAQLDVPEMRPYLQRRADRLHSGNEATARNALASRVMATNFRHQAPGPTNWKQAILDALDED